MSEKAFLPLDLLLVFLFVLEPARDGLILLGISFTGGSWIHSLDSFYQPEEYHLHRLL